MPSVPSKQSRKSTMQPYSPQREMLERAGFGEPEQLALVKRIVETASSELEATKKTPLTDHGELMGEFEQPDYTARAKARDQLISIIGLGKGATVQADPNASQPPPPPWLQSIVVNVDNKAKQPSIEANIEAKVIESADMPPLVSSADPMPIPETNETKSPISE